MQESPTQVGLWTLLKNHPEKFLTHLGQNGLAGLESKIPCPECKVGTIPGGHELPGHVLSACFPHG